jgi:hypothetical protein
VASPLHLSHVVVSFRLTQTLTTLDLYGNRIGERGAQHLCGVLRHNTVSESSLHLSHVAVSFQLTQTLTTLNLRCNEIGGIHAQHLNELKQSKQIDVRW